MKAAYLCQGKHDVVVFFNLQNYEKTFKRIHVGDVGGKKSLILKMVLVVGWWGFYGGGGGGVFCLFFFKLSLGAQF